MAKSGKLYGVPLNEGLRKQLDLRAKNLSKANKDVDQLMVDNNRGAWVTLASSAQIADSEVIKLKEDIKKYIKNHQGYDDNVGRAVGVIQAIEADPETAGNKLAQGNILSGGTLYLKPEVTQGKTQLKLNRREGIDFSAQYSPFSNPSSYEHNPEFGFQPMMGITDFKIATQSAFGTLRKATLTIKAHSPDQLSILETLYFRPGFTMLLEWGNSSYTDNNGDISSYNLGVANDFTSGNINEIEVEDPETKEKVKVSALQQLRDKIVQNREDSGYNYDGFIGVVVNFSWKLGENNSYDCTLDLLSKGDVVDALKTVYTPNSKTNLEKYKDDGQAETSGGSDDLLIDALDIFKNKDKRKEYISNEYPESKVDAYYGDRFLTEASTEEDADGKAGRDRFYYLTLRDFCYVFNKQILEKQNTGNVKIRLSTKFNRSIMSTFAGHISNDPAVCMMPYRSGQPYTPNPKGGSKDISFTEEVNLYGGYGALIPETDKEKAKPLEPTPSKWSTRNFQTNPNKRVPLESGLASESLPKKFKDEFSHDSPYKILVNIEHLKRIQQSFLDQKNEDHEVKTVVSQFFNKLLGDLNSALGGINHLGLFFDEDNSEYAIVDYKCFDLQTGVSTDTPSSTPPLLNVIGLKSEVSKLDIQSKISNDMLSMLSIAATASGQDIDESMENFLKYNENVRDRFVPDPKPEVKTNKKKSSTVWKEAKENGPYNIALPYHTYVCGEYKLGGVHLGKKYSAEAFEKAKPHHYKYMQALNDHRQGVTRQSGVKKPFNGGSLPIELSLTIRGISGLKIGEAFIINQTLLPERSRGKVGFTITGIDHQISTDNIWSTNISTAMYNLPDTEIPVEDEYEEPVKEVLKPPADAPKETPNANRLRAKIAAAGYREKQKSGYSSGELTSALDAVNNKSGKVDITSEIADAGIALIDAVKKEVPDVTLIFTGGNDKYHHGLTYTSRHVKGSALDFVMSPYSNDAYKKILKIIQGFAAGENDSVRFKDEYKRLTAAGTGAHFHLSFGPGSEGKNELKQSIKLVNDGKVEERKIT